ncbi:MAG: preprotein translocase subunit SecE [Clostridiales bacterium]|nr:preprotein translocase subunit SecE [Clostridiales bacterium]
MIRRNTIKLISLLVAACLLCSVFAVSVFADGEDTTVEETTEVVTTTGEETETTADETETTADDTETTAAGEEETTTPTETTAPAGNTGDDTSTTTENKSWFAEHINLVIAVGVIVVLVIAYFVARLVSKKFKEKSTKFWKDYKAEFKKLVWPTKEQFWKNSLVVLVAIVIGAVVLALLDYGITQGFYGLKELIDTIRPAN